MPRTGLEGDADRVAMDELDAVLGVETRVVADYVELGLVRPTTGGGRVSLAVDEVARLSRALRLARELELHAAAAALLVELLEERDDLRRRIACLEQLAGRLA